MTGMDKYNEKFSQDSNNNSEENRETEGVSIILGDPKKAILKLSSPLMVAMILTSMYNVTNGIWVAGLGQNALAAIGFIAPMSLIVVGFSSGLSNGAISVISRFIGANNKRQVDNAALHIILLIVIFAVAIAIILVLFLKPILIILGAGSTIELGLQYGYMLFGGSIFLIFTTVAYGILRAEGNVKKTAYAMSFGAVLNMILDPIFIYELNMGIAGSGLADVVSMAVVAFIILYWFRGDTYINFALKNFKYSIAIMKEILAVGLPSSGEFLIRAILVGLLNIILITVSGVETVAVLSAGYNVILLSIVLLAPVSISVIVIVGASFGAGEYGKISTIQDYSIKLGTLIAVILAIITFALAPYIAKLFTFSPETAGLAGLITEFLRLMTLFYIFVPMGTVASSIFLGVGKGIYSFVSIAIRELLLAVVFAYILAIPLGFGQQGVWYGIVIGNIFGNLIVFVWSKLYIKRIITISKG